MIKSMNVLKLLAVHGSAENSAMHSGLLLQAVHLMPIFHLHLLFNQSYFFVWKTVENNGKKPVIL